MKPKTTNLWRLLWNALEVGYLCLRIEHVRFQNRIVRFQGRILRFQNRVIAFKIRQTLLKYRGKWNLFEYVQDYAHNVLLIANETGQARMKESKDK